MFSTAVTINVGGGEPGSTRARESGMTEWARRACQKRSVVVFAQQVPSDAWFQVWRDAGYFVLVDHSGRWRIRSALITAPGIDIDRDCCRFG